MESGHFLQGLSPERERGCPVPDACVFFVDYVSGRLMKGETRVESA